VEYGGGIPTLDIWPVAGFRTSCIAILLSHISGFGVRIAPISASRKKYCIHRAIFDNHRELDSNCMTRQNNVLTAPGDAGGFIAGAKAARGERPTKRVLSVGGITTHAGLASIWLQSFILRIAVLCRRGSDKLQQWQCLGWRVVG
jgi:hypothetical protein